MLIQEYLDGIEYVVDSQSSGGKNVLAAVWEYSKKKEAKTGSITYEYTKLLPAKGEIQDQIVSYVWKCLEALGIRYGPSHAEVFMTSSGPCLVEVGNRLHGSWGPKMAEYHYYFFIFFKNKLATTKRFIFVQL